MKRPTPRSQTSHDKALMRLLFLFMFIGLWLCWMLNTDPQALAHGPQLIPWILSHLTAKLQATAK
ncbi:MAG: hypothetical protein ACRDHZ_08715 [Ktedonobacteraceae bacterium]